MERCKFAPVYEVIEGSYEDKDNGTYVGYGITCHREDILGLHSLMKEIEDISTEREMVADIAELFNKYCLSPDCFQEAVVNILSQQKDSGRLGLIPSLPLFAVQFAGGVVIFDPRFDPNFSCFLGVGNSFKTIRSIYE